MLVGFIMESVTIDELPFTVESIETHEVYAGDIPFAAGSTGAASVRAGRNGTVEIVISATGQYYGNADRSGQTLNVTMGTREKNFTSTAGGTSRHSMSNGFGITMNWVVTNLTAGSRHNISWRFTGSDVSHHRIAGAWLGL